MNSKCRTCLKFSTKTFPLTKLLNECAPGITYAQLLMEYAQLEYNAAYENHLPQVLCFLCCSQLKSTYVFIQQAQKCNLKLIKDLAKKFCLQEQVIDLPQQQDETTVSIQKKNRNNPAALEDENMINLIANEENSNHENNLVKNKSIIIAEPILTTEQIITYDIEDNKSFIAETSLTTEQIIEYDSEDSMEIDYENFTIETSKDTVVLNSKEECFLSENIEALESQDSFLAMTSLHEEKSSSKQTFTCAKCSCEFNYIYEYLNHMQEKHKSSENRALENKVEKQKSVHKVIKCRICDHTARTKSGLRYHRRTKHGTEDDNFKCNFCSYSTRLNKYTLLRHVKTAHKELIKTLKANVMNNMHESYNSKTNNRLNDNCSTNYLITTSVNEEYSSDKSNSDNDHKEEESSDEDFIRNLINMKKKPTQKLSTKVLVIRCEECDKIFKNHKTLRAHQHFVHKGKDKFLLCPYCDKKCKRKDGLQFHIRNTHGPKENKPQPKPRSKEKRFMCAECSYTCTTSTVLNIHNRLHHTGERPYKCDICSKSFVVPHDLKIHRYLHTGEKPYKCHVCLKSFRDNTHLLNHKRLHTNENKIFTCDECEKSFTKSYNLSVHKRTHLKGNKLSCSVCGKFFKNNSMLNIHQINENHYNEAV